MRVRHRAGDLVDGAPLPVGERERQPFDESFQQDGLGVVRDADLILRDSMLPECDAELEREQLVELQPLPGSLEVLR